MSLLKTHGLVKQYSGRRVVNQVDLELHKGEIVGLLGPNGAGKTTTFNMIVGITRPNEGRIVLDGRDVTGLPMHKRARLGLGYLAQEKSVFRKLTVRQNIQAIAEILPLTRGEQKRRVEAVLDELGIAHLSKQPAYTLSGGERRRVEIARALVCEPTFMLLDEPFSGVDPKAVEELQNVIYQMQRRGLGILITDHSVRETLTVTDRAYLIYEGQVLISGTAADLVNDPKARQYYLGERFYMDVQPDARKTHLLSGLFHRRHKDEERTGRPHPPEPPADGPDAEEPGNGAQPDDEGAADESAESATPPPAEWLPPVEVEVNEGAPNQRPGGRRAGARDAHEADLFEGEE